MRQPQRYCPKVLSKILGDQQRRRDHPACHKHCVGFRRHTPVLYGICPTAHPEDVRVVAAVSPKLIVAAPTVEHVVPHAPLQRVAARPSHQRILPIAAIQKVVAF